MTNLSSVIRRNIYVIAFFFLAQFLWPLVHGLFVEWLRATYGRDASSILTILVGTLLITALFALFLWWLNTRRRPLDLIPERLQPDRYPGLIALVSRPSGMPGTKPDKPPVHELAIQYHLGHPEAEKGPLRVCWLLATEGKEGSMAEAKRIKQAYHQEGTLDIHIITIHSAFDVNETYEAVRQIYRRHIQAYHLKPSQVIADFTGGTKLMSAGMILACQDVWPMEYFQGRPGEIASRPVRIDFHFAGDDTEQA